ncbi:MAG: glycogen synthase GlgA [Geminicoccaceae bacterium]|nr:glycogen synthase GlgA [Geminicoccaceae bacterium]
MSGTLPVLQLASEAVPLVKTGGLADVVGALPAALAEHGIAMRTLLPGYPAVLAGLAERQELSAWPELMGGPARLLAGRAAGLELFVLDAPHLFDRAGDPYRAPSGGDWPDNAERFAALGWAAREIGLGALEAWRPALVHAHDWQAGLAPAYLALAGGPRPGTVLTIHNLAFQGQFPASLLAKLRLPAESFTIDGVEYYGAIGFLKAGIAYADRITTVSPTYAREIRTPALGMGLDGLLRHRADRLVGIVNGIDERLWDPGRDPHLPQPFDADRLELRAVCRRALCDELGLDPATAPLFCVVTRLTWQKGMDLLLEALPRLLGLGGALAMLAAGDPPLEAAFAEAARGHPGRIAVRFGYDEGLAHRIFAGTDAILVPSRFEPCGLTQLYALRYGAVPVVARVGGLADTVIDANDAALADGVATGILFGPPSVEALVDALERAVELFGKPEAWSGLQRRGMSRRLGWSNRAAAYAALYRALAGPQTP